MHPSLSLHSSLIGVYTFSSPPSSGLVGQVPLSLPVLVDTFIFFFVVVDVILLRDERRRCSATPGDKFVESYMERSELLLAPLGFHFFNDE